MKTNTTNADSIAENLQIDAEEVSIEEILLREERACACLCTYNAN